MTGSLVLFTKSNCPACVALKKVLRDLGITVQEFTEESEKGTCETLGVIKYPTLMWYQDGEQGRMEGYSPQGFMQFMRGIEARNNDYTP